MQDALAGLWPPIATPFGVDGSVDITRALAHARRLLAEGAGGLAILGTTGETTSMSVSERHRVIDGYLEGGIPPSQIIAGTGACGVEEAGALLKHASEADCAAVLLLPPFYYKPISDEGLFAFAAKAIERAGAKAPRVLLYHIPPMTVIGWSPGLVARLIEAFPGVIIGMKDSSRDAEHTVQVIKDHPGFVVFPGAETYLVKAMAAGAAGAISATANINAANIAALVKDWQGGPDAERHQQALNVVREAAEVHGMIPSLKAVLATRYRDDTWLNVQPPLVTLGEAARAELLADPAIAGLLEAKAA